MKGVMRYGFILALICTLASAALALVYSLTKARITAQAQAEEQDSLKEVLPQGESFTPVSSENNIIYYKAYDKDGKFIGMAFKAQAKGYSSTIETMTGLTKEGQILAVKILNQNETPGLGARIVEPSFTGQFSNKDIQDLNEVQAITGATISSKAVIDSVKKKTEELKKILKDEPR